MSTSAPLFDAVTDPLHPHCEPSDANATCNLRPGVNERAAAGFPQLPGYEILEELGRGGMGVVYRAWQRSLQRTVALKMILGGAFAGKQEIDRFRSEAMAIARLHHPHLLSIYEIGANENLPFYAMEYVAGGNLARRLNGKPIEPRVAAGLVRALTEAMDYAHRNGIVHRDLKPANILLAGQPDTPLEACIPKITDFGVAKLLDDDTGHTRTGDILGTPHYMAPEQAVGDSAKVGPTADVYSLGAILYELLAGRAPFHGYDGAAVLIRITREDPARPSYYVRGLPRDLQTICMKCLEKMPGQRYASAAALADDLGRYLKNEPIQARPASMADRAFKWARRRPAWAAVLGMTMALVLVAFAAMTVLWRQAVDHAAAQDELLSALKVSRAGDYLERGVHLAQKGDVRRGMHLMLRALEVADEIQDAEPQAKLLVPVIRLNLSAWGQCVNTREAKLAHRGWAWDVGFSADGKLAVTAGRDGLVKFWDAETAEQVGEALEHPYPVWSFAFYPDGRTLFTLCGDQKAKVGALHVWNADPNRPGHYSPRGKPLAFASDSFILRMNARGDRLWVTSFEAGNAALVGFDAQAEGSGLTRVAEFEDAQADGAFSPDGKTLATISGSRPKPGNRVNLWDAATGSATGAPLELAGAARFAEFSKDGRFVIVGNATGESVAQGESSVLQVRDWAKQRWVAKSPPLFGRLKAIAIAPSGQMFAASIYEYAPGQKESDPVQAVGGHVTLWQLHADGKIDSYGQPLRTEDAVWSMQFSPDNRFLLAGARNSGAFLWSVANCQRLLPVQWHEGNCVKVAFRGDGKQVVTASAGGNNYAAARLWEMPAFGHIGQPMPQPTPVRRAFWDADGRHAWLACGETLNRWHPERGLMTEEHRLERIAYFANPTKDPCRFVLDFGENDLASFNRDTGACEKLANFNPQRAGRNYMLEFQPHLERILQHWNKPSKFRILNYAGEALTPIVSDPGHEFLAWHFSPDGKTLAIAQGETNKPACRLRLYDSANLALLSEFPLQQTVITMAYSPDGTTIALGGPDRQVLRLDVRTGEFHGPPLLLETNIVHAGYVRDNRLMYTCGEKGHILLWDAPTGKRIGPAFEHFADLAQIVVHPNGDRLLTATTSRMAMTWRFPESAAGSLDQIRLWVETLTGMEMNVNDTITPLDANRLGLKRRQLAQICETQIRRRS